MTRSQPRLRPKKAGVKRGFNPFKSQSRGMNEGVREIKEFVVPPDVLTQWLRKGGDDGKGRAVIECGPEGPKIADTVWMQVTPPDDFTVARVLPRLPMGGAAQPLALAERINSALAPPAYSDKDGNGDDLKETRNGAGSKKKRKKKEGAVVETTSQGGDDLLEGFRVLAGL